jgi:hypothetical protein
MYLLFLRKKLQESTDQWAFYPIPKLPAARAEKVLATNTSHGNAKLVTDCDMFYYESTDGIVWITWLSIAIQLGSL